MAWYKETEIQQVIYKRLLRQGFIFTGDSRESGHGVDLKMYHPRRRYYWFIEVKGYPIGPSEYAQRQNYLWQVLGQILTRIIQKHAYYGICLPDYRGFYRKKVLDKNLRFARKWLGLYFFLVTKDAKVLILSPSANKFRIF